MAGRQVANTAIQNLPNMMAIFEHRRGRGECEYKRTTDEEIPSSSENCRCKLYFIWSSRDDTSLTAHEG